MKMKLYISLFSCWILLANVSAQKVSEDGLTDATQEVPKAQRVTTNGVNTSLDTITKITSQSLFEKIKREGTKEVILAADFEKLFDTRFEKDAAKQQATITLKNDSTDWQLPVKIGLRGRFRRKKCDFPPIKLDFPKGQLQEMGLHAEFDELKLVTHCLDGTESDQTLLKEYWSYRLYNQLTPNSFQVHLIKITYLDINNPSKTEQRLAFLIENNKELANRMGGTLANKFGMTPAQLDSTSYYQTVLFNFMIGNIDWNIRAQRNIKYIQKDSILLVVPYDFDQSAIVKAPYAKPHPDAGQEKLEDRLCLGQFPDAATLSIFLQQFSNLEKAFGCFNSCPYLTNKHKLRMTAYVNSFYEPLDSKKYLRKTFLRK